MNNVTTILNSIKLTFINLNKKINILYAYIVNSINIINIELDKKANQIITYTKNEVDNIVNLKI